VPLVSLIIAFFIHRRVGAPVHRTTFSNVAGWVVLLGSLLLQIVAMQAGVMFASGFALIGVLLGLTVVWGGWPLLRAYWLPIVFLVFMVPLPMSYIADLNFRLKTIAGGAAVWMTNHVFGVPANMDGSNVHLLPGPDGEPKTLVVENVCSGLRSLISLVCFAALFALICRAKGFWRIVMLALAVPVAVLCNILRITSLNLVAHYKDIEAAGPESTFHNMSGLFVFALALGLLFGFEQLILWLGKVMKKDWADARPLGYLEAIPRGLTGLPAIMRAGTLIALAIVAGLSVMLSIQPPMQNRGAEARQAVPMAVTLGSAPFSAFDFELDAKTLAILETNDYACRRYTDTTRNSRTFDLLIVFSPDNRKGTHPPEVCLTGAGEEVVEKRLQDVPVQRVGDVEFRELITQRGANYSYHLYTYKCGNSYTPGFFTQQVRIFLNGLLRRNAAGALIHITVPIQLPRTDEGTEEARQLALASAKALMQPIDEKLP